MQSPDHPIGEALDIDTNILVDLRAPRGNFVMFQIHKAVEDFLTHGPNQVDSGLHIEIVLVHNDRDEVARRLSLGLLHVV